MSEDNADPAVGAENGPLKVCQELANKLDQTQEQAEQRPYHQAGRNVEGGLPGCVSAKTESKLFFGRLDSGHSRDINWRVVVWNSG